MQAISSSQTTTGAALAWAQTAATLVVKESLETETKEALVLDPEHVLVRECVLLGDPLLAFPPAAWHTDGCADMI